MLSKERWGKLFLFDFVPYGMNIKGKDLILSFKCRRLGNKSKVPSSFMAASGGYHA